MQEKKRNSPSSSASHHGNDGDHVDRNDDAPELSAADLRSRKVTWRIGSKVVSPSEGRRAMRSALTGKTRTNIHLDNDIIAHFKNKAGDRGYQTLINAALRKVMEGEQNQDSLRQLLREELAAAFTPVTSIATLSVIARSSEPHVGGVTSSLEAKTSGGAVSITKATTVFNELTPVRGRA